MVLYVIRSSIMNRPLYNDHKDNKLVSKFYNVHSKNRTIRQYTIILEASYMFLSLHAIFREVFDKINTTLTNYVIDMQQ